MTKRAALLGLGRSMTADLSSGRLGPKSERACRALEAQPAAALDLIDLYFIEGAKKRSNKRLMEAFGFMIGHALEIARCGIEAGRKDMASLADAVRHKLIAISRSGRTQPDLLLEVLRELARAKLDPGPELRAEMERRAVGTVAEPEAPPGLEEQIVEFARDLGGNPFAMHERLEDMLLAFPDEPRAAAGALLLRSREAAAREAALGWLLDPAEGVRKRMAFSLEQAAGTDAMSGVMLRRMIALRNWLPEADRAPIDQAIQSCQRKGAQPTVLPQPEVREVLTSGIDRAGAQSIFILVKEGRNSAVASLLIKHGIGVRHAWVRHGLSRTETDEFFERLQDIELRSGTLDFARLASAHALAVNLRSGVMPPFGMLDFVESAGLLGLQPEELSPDAVLAGLEAEADPALLRPEAAAPVLESSDELTLQLSACDAWFEADDEVECLLRDPRLSHEQRIALVESELLPRRRAKWVERLAWTALMLRHCKDRESCQTAFICARELRAGRQPAEIALMNFVAATTVDAFEADPRNAPPRKRSRRGGAGARKTVSSYPKSRATSGECSRRPIFSASSSA